MATVDVEQAASIILPASPPLESPPHNLVEALSVSEDLQQSEPPPSQDSIYDSESRTDIREEEDVIRTGITTAEQENDGRLSQQSTVGDENSIERPPSSTRDEDKPDDATLVESHEGVSVEPVTDRSSAVESVNCTLHEERTVSIHPHESPPPSTPSTDSYTNGHNKTQSNTTTASVGNSAASGSKAHQRSLTISKGHTVSTVLITSALETIATSKEARRSAPLRDSVKRALDMVHAGEGGDRPREIFEPLRLACETRNEKLMVTSLDCISKLISYSFFVEATPASAEGLPSPPPSPGLGPRNSMSAASQTNIPPISLVDLVVHTITSCHTETTPETVSLQIVKALLALVLSSTILVHQSSLLKTVRTVYNVFLLSTDPVNQMVAQGGLTQMVHHVFTRCKIEESHPTPSESPSRRSSRGLDDDNFPHRPLSAASMPQTPPFLSSSLSQETGRAVEIINGTQVATPSLENGSVIENPVSPPASIEGPGTAPFSPPPGDTAFATNGTSHPGMSSTLSLDALHVEPTPHNGAQPSRGHQLTINDLFIKDAFLVFRALCKLTMKPVNTESERDLKSHAMRSKLLSLHLVLTILNSHMALFVAPSSTIYSSSSHEATPFVQAVNQYLCLSLSRNAVSSVSQVFELSVEIFWRVISGMRTKLKKEIEVLLHEIFIPILEMKTSTLKQKATILGMLQRLAQDPQALVEIYLNYDCDSQAADNIYEHLMNTISKIGITSSTVQPKNQDPTSPGLPPTHKPQHGTALPPSLSTTALSVPGSMDISTLGLSDFQLRRQGLECLVTVLRSLVAWGTTARETVVDSAADARANSRAQEESRHDATTPNPSLDRLSIGAEVARQPTPDNADDPSRFESAKQKKTTLLEGIKKFNSKPKRGIDFFVENGFIASRTPQDVARFLLNTDGLNKAMIGEYLGEGNEENIATMHAFVDILDLRNLTFVDALRTFLQTFRLPGESQKVERFMEKFAERYFTINSQTPFATAGAAFVLAYSTIMLNTDAHNPQVKNRMTKAGFVKNNAGINDGADLPEEFLSALYDDIVANEIRMRDEVGAVVATPGTGLANALANVGRDLQREAYLMQSSGMANKTEALFRTMIKTQRRGSRTNDQFYSASHGVHVRPMFEAAWMPLLAGLSGPLQDTDDSEIIELCLDGFKSAIHIACFFDLELERNAFVTTLAKFTFLNNLGEMKSKNMEAIKTLLDVALNEGNYLKASWHEVLTCVSQLEHMQLISSGVELSDSGRKGRPRALPTEELANESRSTHITVAADMIFSLSHYLSGTAIVDFVHALCDVSWDEIQSSGMSPRPRLFSLQKLVEISYYNMNRIRLEWLSLWEILGQHFNQVCCHSNPNVGFFALDSLRQLAMRFLEKEELPHFTFQKDFLKPFEYTMIHNANPDVRDMVLQCLQQMIQARVQNMRSGWRTLFGILSAASKVLTERIVNSAFEIVTRVNRDHFPAIARHGSFADLTVCVTDFCKVSKYQKISLLAIGMLRGIIPVMLECPDCSSDPQNPVDDPMIKFWFPVLFGFYDIIMNAEDLEVRRLALDSLFTTLKTYGSDYPVEFWDTVCQELLFPIFAVLKSSQDLSRWNSQEDMSVWLQTTMIQALRDLIDLYTYHFAILERTLDGLLDLLCVCICQENDTLGRIGTSCLQQLIENNVKKMSPARWERIATTFVKLFRMTTPHQLFDESLRVDIEGSPSDFVDTNGGQTMLPAPLSPSNDQAKPGAQLSLGDRRRIFKQIIVKCVLQLLLIETLNDLLRNDLVYTTIPPEHLLKLMGVLDHSYQFARSFNEDKELRMALWKVGFMKHLPNLLKQESSSASTLVHVLLRMYFDPRPDHQAARPQIAERLLPLELGVLQDYNRLQLDTQAKNIAAWTPVVAEILQGFCRFDDKAFMRWLPAAYPLATDLLSREVPDEIREGLRDYFMRVGYAQGIIERT
ncbi:hypothetical protein NEOLEDRAFT_1094323 [Neolentinus lepideus HHB14362 ss-1]|uniref:SEC7 domain-containing protein n=1 Tax=Neolentinus lepideus HHB14362 ss-1 TaxID=1314782 RepID=A0A165S1D3_9AGAM|nr:hypothetical protein NEOLEDRAFT_1094323 [Neolentinus lepideus HHB14362 ss-1]